MNWIQSIFYGLISGITDFLPVSSQAHQRILLFFFGKNGYDPVLSFVIRIGLIGALYVSLRNSFIQIRRERLLKQRNRNKYTADAYRSLADARVVTNAAIPLLIGVFLIRYIFNTMPSLPYVVLGMFLNGFVLYLPQRFMHGNKSANQMSKLDSTLIGIACALSCLPGFSGIGLVLVISLWRGADRDKSLAWALLLSLPALIVFACIDAVQVFSTAASLRHLSGFFAYLLAGISAFVGGYCGIALVKRAVLCNQISIF